MNKVIVFGYIHELLHKIDEFGALVEEGQSGKDKEFKPGEYNRGFTEFQALIELARINGEPLELTLDDSDLYDVFLCQPETYIQPVSTIQGVVMGRYIDVEVHMSFREEDRPSYEGF